MLLVGKLNLPRGPEWSCSGPNACTRWQKQPSTSCGVRSPPTWQGWWFHRD